MQFEVPNKPKTVQSNKANIPVDRTIYTICQQNYYY